MSTKVWTGSVIGFVLGAAGTIAIWFTISVTVGALAPLEFAIYAYAFITYEWPAIMLAAGALISAAILIRMARRRGGARGD